MKFKIYEWELIKGIKLKNLKGFKGERNKIINRLYTEKQFKQGAILCNLVCKTEKGLEFINS